MLWMLVYRSRLHLRNLLRPRGSRSAFSTRQQERALVGTRKGRAGVVLSDLRDRPCVGNDYFCGRQWFPGGRIRDKGYGVDDYEAPDFVHLRRARETVTGRGPSV